jgi:hypothetical protein
VTIYVSFYVEATNRDAFMAVKQDLLLAFIDCVERNGAKLAKQRLEVGKKKPIMVHTSCEWVSEYVHLSSRWGWRR